MFSFVVRIHRRIPLAVANGAGPFDQVDSFHLVDERSVSRLERTDLFAGIEIKAGKHVKHGYSYR